MATSDGTRTLTSTVRFLRFDEAARILRIGRSAAYEQDGQHPAGPLRSTKPIGLECGTTSFRQPRWSLLTPGFEVPTSPTRALPVYLR